MKFTMTFETTDADRQMVSDKISELIRKILPSREDDSPLSIRVEGVNVDPETAASTMKKSA